MTWDPDRTIEAELQPGEIVRWTGQPSFFPMLWSQASTIAFGLIFAGVPLVGLLQGWVDWAREIELKDDIGGLIFMSAFVLFGLGFAGGGLLEAFSVWRTVYAVTNRRVLIIKRLVRHRVLAITPGGMNAFEWQTNADGSGSITVRREVYENSEGNNTRRLGFVGTRDIHGAILAIERLRTGAA